MEKLLLSALVANTSSLSVHWIYDHQYLEGLFIKESLLFRDYQATNYKEADLAFDAYPNSKVGDLSVQAQIALWLYQAMKHNPDFKKSDYEALLFDHFRPGGSYHGYVETYAKRHVLNILNIDLKTNQSQIDIKDDHLVGFMPYIVCKALNLDRTKAFELTNVYSNEPDYLNYFLMFDEILANLEKKPMKEALMSSINFGPSQYQITLSKALEMTDTNLFIETYASRACSIKDAVPLIMHILAHTSTFEKALEKNASIGGASADRASLIGFLYAKVSDIPKAWQTLVKDKINL